MSKEEINDELEKVALKAKLKLTNQQLENVLRVCDATGNFRVAVEMLCGIYKEPNVGEFGINSQNQVCTYENYDPFTDQVAFTYKHPVKKSVYCPSNMECEELEERLDEFKDKTRQEIENKYGDYTYHYVVADPDIFTTSKQDCSLDRWVDYTKRHEDLAFK